MNVQKLPAAIHLWEGDFTSQQLAFAHLLDAADQVRTVIDLDHVEVIPGDACERRLAPYFDDPPILGNSKVVVLLATPPGEPCPFFDTDKLTYLGCHEGHVVRPKALWS